MSRSLSLPGLVADLANAQGPLETGFKAAGTELERASLALGSITGNFDALVAELRSTALTTATRDLELVGNRVQGMTVTTKAERQLLERLLGSLGQIASNLATMTSVIRTVGALTVNAKICAAAIQDGAGDFSGFIAEITRLFGVSRQSLVVFGTEVERIRTELQAALATQDSFEKEGAEAMQAIPAWMADSVTAVARRRDAGLRTSLIVQQRVQHAGQRTGEAIMALQIADSTRQRIEHVQDVLRKLDGVLAQGEAALTPEGGRHEILSNHICRLQAAQLRDAAAEFEQQTQRLTSALQALATDAGHICVLGTDINGGSSEGPGGFLGELERVVGQASRLLRGVEAGQAKADAMAQHVASAVGRLVGHIDTVRGLESDLRLMSLNMTFKSGRLGDQGRTLYSIAQEIRNCADQTTRISALIMDDLTSVTTLANSHLQQERHGGEGAAPLDGMMAEAMANLGAAGRSITEAIGALEQHGQVAAAALAAAARLTTAGNVEGILRRVAGRLDDLAKGGPVTPADLLTIKDELARVLSAKYSMASQRRVEARMTGQPVDALDIAPAPQRAPSQPAAAVLDDILF